MLSAAQLSNVLFWVKHFLIGWKLQNLSSLFGGKKATLIPEPGFS